MTKNKYFRTYFEPYPIETNPGTDFLDEYSYEFDSDGKKSLVKTGKKNIKEEIQAWKDYCNIKLMVERFELGDEEALNRVQGIYGDFTEMPKTYAEMVKRVQDCRDTFYRLDPDVKTKFGNDPDVFWSLYGSGEFYERLTPKVAEEIVIENEKEVINE